MTAKTMFEKLGFKLDEDFKDTIVWEKESFPQCTIYFYSEKEIEIVTHYAINMKILEAINKQVEEKGWKYENN